MESMFGGWRACRSIADRASIGATMLVLCCAVALAVAPAAAASTDFTWSGGDPEGLWTLADNWVGGTTPSGSVGTLSFLDLGSGCDDVGDWTWQRANGSNSLNCVETDDDSGAPITAEQLQLADDFPGYFGGTDTGTDIITLDGDSNGVGLQGTPVESESLGIPDVTIPIVLGSSQTWRIDGDASVDGVTVDDVTDPSNYDLHLQLGGDLYTTSLQTGTGTVSADGDGYLVVENNPNDRRDQPMLPDTVLSQGAGLQVTATDAESGSIEAGLGYPDNVVVGSGAPPDGILNVTGNVTLGSLASLDMFIDGTTSPGSLTDPSIDQSQLNVTGTIDLGQANLDLELGADSDGNCEDLYPGQTYTLISAATINGELEEDGSPIPNGGTVKLANDCNGVVSTPTVSIIYDTSSSPETITAYVQTTGHAADLPTLIGDSPTVAADTPFVGIPLQASAGGWDGNPTSYDYTWYSCSALAGPDCDNEVGTDVSTYTPSVGDLANTIEVCVSANNAYGTSTYEYCSDPTMEVLLPPAPSNTGSRPTVTGTAQVDNTLAATPGNWSGSPTFSYQWQHCGAQAQVCTNISGATSSSYTLSSSDVGQSVRVEVVATNIGGTTVAYSNTYGPVPEPTVQTSPTTPLPTSTPVTPTTSAASSAQIKSALIAIAHPAGKKSIAELVRTGSFKTGFNAPTGGSLSVIWTTTVTSGTGKRRKPKTATVARGSANTHAATRINVTLHLTGVGKALLSKKETGLAAVASESFKPEGQPWRRVTKKFKL
jgi:hypothetical protein